MPRNSNWFTARRNQGRREGHNHRIPVCSRHGQIRYNEEPEGSSSSTTEDERRELERRRERRRDVRNRIREEENHRSEGGKKRSAKSRICAWLNCFCGVLIVIGLIFVFYVITTLIIDGSSPLDFLSFSNNNHSSAENSTNLNKSLTPPPPPPPERNKTDGTSQNKSNEIVIKDKEIEVKSTSTTSSVNRQSKEATENNFKADDQNTGADSEIRFRPGLDVESTEREVKFIKGTDGRSYIAFVPVPLDSAKDNKGDYVERKKEEIQLISVNRNGKSPHLYGYENPHKFSDRSDNHRIIRPITQTNYENRRSSDSENLDSKIISHYVPPPNDRKIIQRIIKLSPSSDNRPHYKESSPIPYDTHLRRIGNSRDTDQKTRYNLYEQTIYGSSFPDSSRRPPMRDKYGDIPSQSFGISVNSKHIPFPRSPNERRAHNQNRDRPTDNKNYNSHRIHGRRQRPSQSIRKRPPSEFRYPSNAGSIQDIIAYMNKRDRNEGNKHHEPNYGNRNQRNNLDNLNKPSEFYDGEQGNVNTFDNDERPIYYVKEDGSVLESFSSEEAIDRTRFDVNNYNEYVNGHNVNHDSANDRNHLPPVMNTYNVHGSDRSRPNEKKPLRLMLDIYPVEDQSGGSASNNLHSSISIEEDYPRHDNNERYQTEDARKKEIILHLNLFTQQPTHRSEPDLRENAVSMEIPIKGKLSPLDIYKAFVAQARKSPVASPRRGHLSGTSNQFDGKIKARGISADEGRRLFDAIEDGLRQLDSYLPDENKILFSEVPVTEEDLLNAGSGPDGDFMLFQNHRTER